MCYSAFLICDRVGRLWATRALCTLWIVGIAIFMGHGGSLGAVYAGRFIAGLGVGQTVVVGPVYLAEIAPAPIRGLCTCVFTGFVYLGIVLAYFANYGCALHLKGTADQWVGHFVAALHNGPNLRLSTVGANESSHHVRRHYLYSVFLPI